MLISCGGGTARVDDALTAARVNDGTVRREVVLERACEKRPAELADVAGDGGGEHGEGCEARRDKKERCSHLKA